MEETQPSAVDNTPATSPEPESKQEVIYLVCLKCGRRNDSLRINGRMTIHQCKCRTLAWKVSGDLKGILCRDEQTFRQFSIRDVGTVQQTALWKHFCAFLDEQRVLMADGTYSAEWCIHCENQPHNGGPLACRCACHPAWAYRQEMEAKRSE